MLKKIALSGLGLALLAAPSFALAQIDVQSQIAALLAQIKQLQALIAQLQSQSGSSRFCYTFNKDLTVGSTSGDDVVNLQNALKLSGFLVLEQAVRFPLDETIVAAVVKFQAKYGIRQTGYVGPLTRAQLNKLYGCHNNQTDPSRYLTASPTSGAAPLHVNFKAPGLNYGSGNQPTDYSIDFGDGSRSANYNDAIVGHDYTTAGTYTATLHEFGGAGFDTIVGTATITVSNGSVGTPSVTLLSPNGWELWAIGSTHTITWNSNNFSGGVVTIYLKDYDFNPNTDNNQTQYLLTHYAPNTGSFAWTVPSTYFDQTLAPGSNYKIWIGANVEGSNGLINFDIAIQDDLSDAPFTISSGGNMDARSVAPKEYDLLKDIDKWTLTYQDTNTSALVCSNGKKGGTNAGYVFAMSSIGYGERPGDINTPYEKVITILNNNGWQQCKAIGVTELQDTQGTSEVFIKDNKLVRVFRHYSMGVGNSLSVQIQYDY